MRKSESYRALFEMARRNPYEAELVAAFIRSEDLDMAIIIKHTTYDYVKNVRVFAEYLLKRIPAKSLNLKILIELQKSKSQTVRNLARNLALKIKPADINYQILKDYMKPGDRRVGELVNKLSKKLNIWNKKQNSK